MYVILWCCYCDTLVFYEDRVYSSIDEVRVKFDEIISNPKYAGEKFVIAKVVPV